MFANKTISVPIVRTFSFSEEEIKTLIETHELKPFDSFGIARNLIHYNTNFEPEDFPDETIKELADYIEELRKAWEEEKANCDIKSFGDFTIREIIEECPKHTDCRLCKFQAGCEAIFPDVCPADFNRGVPHLLIKTPKQ